MIALYLDKNINNECDCNCIENGNPGIGGTEYLTILLTKRLANIYGHNRIILFCEKRILLKDVIIVEVKSFQESIDYLQSFNDVTYIVNPFLIMFNDIINYGDTIKYVFWTHIQFYNNKKCLEFALSKHCYRCVMLTPHSFAYYPKQIRKKSVVIGSPSPYCDINVSKTIKDGYVLLLGALVPLRKADNVLYVWSDVIKKYPQIKLLICGTGNLYGLDANLGPHQLAEPAYEEKLFSIIRDNHLENNVKFLGNVCIKDNYELFNKALFGITNPRYSGNETFCLSAIEMGSFSLSVIAGDIDGLKTTLPKKCGYRVKNNKQLYKAVISLISNKGRCEKYGKNYRKFIKANYNIQLFANNWYKLLEHPNDFKIKKYCFIRLRYLVSSFLKESINCIKRKTCLTHDETKNH